MKKLARLLVLCIFAVGAIAALRSYVAKPGVRHCVLEFGQDGKTRVWLALDGAVLYLDKTGKGDLRNADRYDDAGDLKPFLDITAANGRDRYRITSIHTHNDERVYLMVNAEMPGSWKQYCDIAPVEGKESVPVARFDGPLKMGLRDVFGVCDQKLKRGDELGEIYAWIGTFDRAQGCWVVVNNTIVDTPERKQVDFPADVHPIADIEFPPKRAGEPPIRRRYVLNRRC